jgi:hypothetical protein
MKITVEVYPANAPQLIELYNETVRLFKAAGLEPWSFEQWCENMLAFGIVSHITANARILNNQTRRKYNIETE